MSDGKCQPITKSYKDSLAEGATEEPSINLKAVRNDAVNNNTETGYDIAGQPLRYPGEVLRIRMWEYVDRDVFYGRRSIYTEVRKPYWIEGNQDINK